MKKEWLIFLSLVLVTTGAPTCTTDYTNKYDLLMTLPSAATSAANTASCTFPTSVDTKLYLGDPYTGASSPAKSRDFGLTYRAQEIAVIKASTYLSTSSNYIQSTGSTITMWTYIADS
jgi:hypothetical protein